MDEQDKGENGIERANADEGGGKVEKKMDYDKLLDFAPGVESAGQVHDYFEAWDELVRVTEKYERRYCGHENGKGYDFSGYSRRVDAAIAAETRAACEVAVNPNADLSPLSWDVGQVVSFVIDNDIRVWSIRSAYEQRKAEGAEEETKGHALRKYLEEGKVDVNDYYGDLRKNSRVAFRNRLRTALLSIGAVGVGNGEYVNPNDSRMKRSSLLFAAKARANSIVADMASLSELCEMLDAADREALAKKYPFIKGRKGVAA